MARTPSLFYKASQLPTIGPWIGRVGRVVGIASVPCIVQPEIWVLAAFYNVPTAMWTFLKPSPIDYVTERVGRKKKKFSFLNANPEAGPRINPAGELASIAFKGLKLGERIGWYLSVADATTGFLLNWISTAYRWSGCTVPRGSFGHAHALPDSIPMLYPAGTGTFDLWIWDQSHGIGTGPTGCAVPTGEIASVGFNLEQVFNSIPGLPDCSFTCRIVSSGTANATSEASEFDQANGNKVYSGFYWNGASFFKAANKLIAGNSWSVEITKTEGVLRISQGSFTVTTTPLNDAVTPDP